MKSLKGNNFYMCSRLKCLYNLVLKPSHMIFLYLTHLTSYPFKRISCLKSMLQIIHNLLSSYCSFCFRICVFNFPSLICFFSFPHFLFLYLKEMKCNGRMMLWLNSKHIASTVHRVKNHILLLHNLSS